MHLTGAGPGLSMRAFRASDSPAVAEIANACVGARVLASDAPLHWWERPGTDHQRDLVVIADRHERIRGYARIYADPPFDEPIVMAGIAASGADEDERLGEILCCYAEERAIALTTAPHGGTLLARAPTRCELAARLLKARGYREERHLLSLSASVDALLARLTDAPEMTIEQVGVADLPRAYETLAASFSDHWGTSWPTFAAWRHDLLDGVPLLASSGSEVLGVLVVASSFVEHRDSAQFVELGVVDRRRRSGVARALLRRGAEWALRQHRTRIGLYMDGESTTGATEMFRALGFLATPRFTYWSKRIGLG